jgi:hypothetical protein
MADVTSGIAFLEGLGLPEILLWILSFAVIFEVLIRAGIMRKAPAALVAVALATLVLFAAPIALITTISSMSSSLVLVLIGFFVILAIIEFANIRLLGEGESTTDKDGKTTTKKALYHPFQKHGKMVTIVVLLIALLIFWLSGGAALLGLGNIPSMGVPWVFVIIGIAVLWLMYEAK